MNKEKWVWVFEGEGGCLASAVFTSKKKAENWINETKVSGILTRMPLNVCVYDWTIEKGYFKPKGAEQQTPQFIQRFTSGYLEHYHYLKEEE